LSPAAKKEIGTNQTNLPDGLALRIRQARERKNLSLSDIHKSTGISRTSLHDYESGRTKPGARELLLLAEVLEATPNWLLCGTEEPFKKREGLASLIKLRNSPLMLMVSMLVLPVVMQSLSEDELEALLTLISSMIEAKDKSTYRHISATVEVFAELIGTGSPAELSGWTERSKNPEFIAEMKKKIAARVEEMN
jgi:transcriptional regulator with XRE-family HTH domain